MFTVANLPRMKTALILGCCLLLSTLFWDLVFLRALFLPLHQPLARGSSGKHKRPNVFHEWSWVCVKGEDDLDMCQRVPADSTSRVSLETCTMTCSPGRYIWPLPTGTVKIKQTTASFHPRQLEIHFQPVDGKELSNLLSNAAKLYQEKITRLAKISLVHTTVSTFTVKIVIPKKEKDLKYKLNIDESYKLLVSEKSSKVEATIKASTFLGARHGLETLTQLVWWDERELVLKVMNNVVISDSPVFSYRGVLLDTARSFLPATSILRTIDAMSMNKMNVFHWHLTDSKSFPYRSKKYPKFSMYGSYSVEETYSQKQISEIVEFATVRGVTVLVEVDAPGHTSQGWQWGKEENRGNLSLCLDAQPFSEFCSEAPCGQLNPANNQSYSVLVDVLKELNGLVKSENLIHLGGSSVSFLCWESFEDVTDSEIYMTKGVVGVWELFYQQLFNYLSKEKIPLKNYILWSSQLLDDVSFWRNLKVPSPIVQSRGLSTSGELKKLIKDMFKVIVSPIDLWHLSEPRNWRSVHSYRPWAEVKRQQKKLFLGGEVCVWTDHVDRHSLDIRLWPAASAVAERLWTDPPSGSAPTARLTRIRERMLEVGIPCAPTGPKWCTQNPYYCL